MSKSLVYWETLLALARNELEILEGRKGRPYPTGDRSNPALPPSQWIKTSGRWVKKHPHDYLVQRLNHELWLRRCTRLDHNIARTKRRIAYFEERIAARQLTVWDHVRAGAKEAGKDAARCKKEAHGEAS
ncbi:MAG: hypothetical protein OK454_06075 [Thaumarchaeota archaeon]|nr:hypothetical protein [Nitrososphaerota archaeon]